MAYGFHRDGFDYTFEMKVSEPVTFGEYSFEDVIPVKVYCEPDEDVGCTDWWIASVSLDLHSEDVELSKDDERVQKIMHHAYSVERKHIQSKWEDWLWDRPRPRSSRYQRACR